MAIRESLVASAITFLQDPSVAAAPLEKRIAFLQSKNLTQEEIDASLARAGDPAAVAAAAAAAPPAQQYGFARPPQPQPGYGYPGGPYGYWQQPPPEVPKRDWRDWFIMATVMSGLSYGVYFIAKRYISPLIAPPTPPQLTQDKASIDESFAKAFALIEQLSNDTTAIKTAEDSRKERLDTALSEFETQMSDLKEASRRRDEDTRRIVEDVRKLQTLVPNAMKSQSESQDSRLKELREELRSLKTLLNNRVGTAANAATSAGTTPRASSPAKNGAHVWNGVGLNGAGNNNSAETSDAAVSTETKPNGMGTASRFGTAKGGIPAWQRAAASRQEEAASEKKDGADGAGSGSEGAGASS